MACCGGSLAINNQARVYSPARSVVFSGPCDYTYEMLTSFNEHLVWFKSKALYVTHKMSASTLNSHIGTVLSAMNTNNPCRFKEKLDLIADYVSFIVTLR